MILFALNLALAVAWAALFGGGGVVNLAIGFAVGYGILWLVRPLFGPTRYFRKFFDLLSLAGFFLRELVLSSVYVLWDVVTPRHRSRPGVLRVPIAPMNDAEITVLANLVSLTPGTLSLEIAPDRSALFVHAMFAEDPEAVRREIKDGMERRVLKALR